MSQTLILRPKRYSFFQEVRSGIAEVDLEEFSLAVSALQSYLVNRYPSFRFEYNSLAKENQIALPKLLRDRSFTWDRFIEPLLLTQKL